MYLLIVCEIHAWPHSKGWRNPQELDSLLLLQINLVVGGEGKLVHGASSIKSCFKLLTPLQGREKPVIVLGIDDSLHGHQLCAMSCLGFGSSPLRSSIVEASAVEIVCICGSYVGLGRSKYQNHDCGANV
jgi:hypothetical protein